MLVPIVSIRLPAASRRLAFEGRDDAEYFLPTAYTVPVAKAALVKAVSGPLLK